MPSENETKKARLMKQVGIVLNPKNLLKTFASQVPIASIATGMIDQIEADETERRLQSLEAEAKYNTEQKALEDVSPKMEIALYDWSIPVGEYLRRTVDFVVVYDAGFHSEAECGHELFQPVAHACIIGDHEVLASKEALELARDVANHKHGRAIILVGMGRYEFESEGVDETSGLCICRLTARDEKDWSEIAATYRDHGLGTLENDLISTHVRFSVSPRMGQEVGLVHSGEAKDVIRGLDSFSKRQFVTGVISHFRLPKPQAFRTFVTGVMSGWVYQAGTPVFGRDGVLLGIVADGVGYQSDAGSRAVVRSLLGHPRFKI